MRELEFEIGSLWMTHGGDKCIILYYDFITAIYFAFHYKDKILKRHSPLGEVLTEDVCERTRIIGKQESDTIKGKWVESIDKDRLDFFEAATPIIPQVLEIINNGRTQSDSVMACERKLKDNVDPIVNDFQDYLYTAWHQEFVYWYDKYAEVTVEDFLLNAANEIYEQSKEANHIIWRIYPEVNYFVDEWEIKHRGALYLRASFIKDDTQIILPCGKKEYGVAA